MINDFEWAIETPLPILYEGVTFIITFSNGEHILFEVISFGIGCIDSPLSGNNIGKDVMNYTVLENTQISVSGYCVGYTGEVLIETAENLIEEGYWKVYEKV